jgi:LysR family glycine cleavage system transcriptional activator
MSRDLPPLHALRAFEAAARHLSVTRAAEELFVTQAAVSHQIKALEDWFGQPLFRRAGRGIQLSETGARLLPAASESFDRLAEVSRRLKEHSHKRLLTVTTLDSFAASWLIPRLRDFRAAYPDIDVRLTTADAAIDLAADGIDVAIRLGRGPWPGLYSEELMTEQVFPVCAPGLIDGDPPLRRPEDLKHHTLLHDIGPVGWDMWLRAAGVGDVDPYSGPTFNHTSFVAQAAVAGEGLALGRTAIVADALAGGRLVKPFDLALDAYHAYHFVCLRGGLDIPKIGAFRDWIFAAAARDPEVAA